MIKKYITYTALCFSVVIGWNVFLIQRDQKLFKAYDKVCAELPQPHPDCRYQK